MALAAETMGDRENRTSSQTTEEETTAEQDETATEQQQPEPEPEPAPVAVDPKVEAAAKANLDAQLQAAKWTQDLYGDDSGKYGDQIKKLEEQRSKGEKDGYANNALISAGVGVFSPVGGIMASAFGPVMAANEGEAQVQQVAQVYAKLLSNEDFRSKLEGPISEGGLGRPLPDDFNPVKNLATEGMGSSLNNISLLAEAQANGSEIKPTIIDGQLMGFEITAPDGTGMSTWSNVDFSPGSGSSSQNQNAGQGGEQYGITGGLVGPPCPASICGGEGNGAPANKSNDDGSGEDGQDKGKATDEGKTNYSTSEKGTDDDRQKAAERDADRERTEDANKGDQNPWDSKDNTAMWDPNSGSPHPSAGRDATRGDSKKKKQLYDSYANYRKAQKRTNMSALFETPTQTVTDSVGKVEGALSSLRTLYSDLTSAQPSDDGERVKGSTTFGGALTGKKQIPLKNGGCADTLSYTKTYNCTQK